MFLAQNLILMGVFFAIPLYLQVVQGLDALETGLKMLPVSVTMFIMSFLGARMSATRTPRWIVKVGLWVLLVAVVVLSGTIEPVLEGAAFAISMALLGVGMGLLASQLGNVVQSAVGPKDRSEAGGLQYTAQQLGSSIGTALIGAVVISTLASAFVTLVEQDPRIPPEVSQAIGVELSGSIEFINSSDLEDGLADTDLSSEEIDAIVESYEAGQLEALRLGLFVAGVVVVIALFMVRRIPDMSFEEIAAVEAEDEPIEAG
jgi:MFS family permease